MLASAPLSATPSTHDVADLLIFSQREAIAMGTAVVISEGNRYAWANESMLLVNTSTGSKTIVLPLCVGPVIKVLVQDYTGNSNTNPISIMADTGATLNGDSSFQYHLSGPYASVGLTTPDGLNWFTCEAPNPTVFTPAPLWYFPQTILSNHRLAPGERAVTMANFSQAPSQDPLINL